MYKLAITEDGYFVDGKPVTHDEYMAAPVDTEIDLAMLKRAFATHDEIDDEVGSRTAMAVVTRNYGDAYAYEVGRNR